MKHFVSLNINNCELYERNLKEMSKARLIKICENMQLFISLNPHKKLTALKILFITPKLLSDLADWASLETQDIVIYSLNQKFVIFDELYVKLSLDTEIYRFKYSHTVKPLITNTSEEFIKCRLDNFSMSFILYFVNFSICENK